MLHAQVSYRWRPGWKTDYYEFRDPHDRDDNGRCPQGFNCAWARHVESEHRFDEHELVHAYLGDTAAPPQLFVEGLAQAVSCRITRADLPRVSLAQLLAWNPDRTGGPDTSDHYDTA